MNGVFDLWHTVKTTTVVLLWLVIVGLIISMISTAFASPSCMTKAEARAKWPDAHIWWSGDPRCWSNKRGRHRIMQREREKPKPHIMPEPLVQTFVQLADADVRAEQLPLEKVEPIPFLDLNFDKPPPRVVLPPLVPPQDDSRIEPDPPRKKGDRLVSKTKPLPANENAQLKANLIIAFAGVIGLIVFAFVAYHLPDFINRRKINVSIRRPRSSHRNYGIDQPAARPRETGRAGSNGPRMEQPHLSHRDIHAEQTRVELAGHGSIFDSPRTRAGNSSALGAWQRARSLQAEEPERRRDSRDIKQA